MELRQLRYFVMTAKYGSFSRAARELGMATSALSQQISKLETELSTRLLRRLASGTELTDAGFSFLEQAQLALRHSDNAILAAQNARLSGIVAIGMPFSSGYMIAPLFTAAMRRRYPDIKLRIVELQSSNLALLVASRQLDFAFLTKFREKRDLASMVVSERLCLFTPADKEPLPVDTSGEIAVRDIGNLPLLLPSKNHGLRLLIDNAFQRAGNRPNLVAETDGTGILAAHVNAGLGSTIQAASFSLRLPTAHCQMISDEDAVLSHYLVSLRDDEMSTVAVAARKVFRQVVKQTVQSGTWPGASFHES